MKRKKTLILLCHCILNCNSKVMGPSQYEGCQQDLIKYLVENGYGIIQLPCPELTMYGASRWGHVREQFDTPYFRKHCREIFQPILEQIQDYLQNGYNIKAVVGVDGSPSCGVNMTCSSGKWGGEVGKEYGLQEKIKDLKVINSSGIFIEEINKILNEKNIKIKFIAVDESRLDSSTNEIITSLEE